MAGKKFTPPEVNFLPGDEMVASATGKFLQWALSWGKKIVIVTELVVVLAFLSRFYFDTVSADLSEQIQHKLDIINSSSEFEDQFRAVSRRARILVQEENTPSPVTVLNKITALVPTSVTLTQINIEGDTVNFSGNGADNNLADMVAKFKDSTTFHDLTVDKVAKGEQASVNFTAKVVYSQN